MNRLKNLTQRAVETPSTRAVAKPTHEKTVYKGTKIPTAIQARTVEFQNSSGSILESKQKAQSSLVGDKTKPDIVNVTEETQKVRSLNAPETNGLSSRPGHRDFANLGPNQKAAISKYAFSNEDDALLHLVDPNNAAFKAFRKDVLKEEPDARLTLNAVKKFSEFIHKAEVELGKKFVIISSIDSKYEDAGVFRPKSPIAKQISASEYLKNIWLMTDQERNVFEIFSTEYVENHMSHFENGIVTQVTLSAYLKFMKNSPTLGRQGEKGGRWVQPKDTIDKAFQYQKEKPHLSLAQVLTTKLGWAEGSLDNDVMLALIDHTTSVDDLEMPTREHQGANNLFFDSGHTHGTLEKEVIAPVIEKNKIAIGIFGLPEDHALHPSNAKPGNYLEVEKFLSSEKEVNNLKRLMRTPLQELKPNDL